MSTLFDDLRFTIRMLVTSPGFAATAVLTVALGIGATTALFSVVNGVLVNPLAYPDADRLTALYERAPGFDKAPISFLNFLDWQRLSQTFASMAIYRNQGYSLTGAGEAERVNGLMVSADFLRTLGEAPIVGRDFQATDDRVGAAPVVMVGGGYSERRFGAASAALGRVLTLNGVPYTVVGVVPARFEFYGSRSDVYTPIGQWNDRSFRDRRVDVSAHAVGRLLPDVSVSQARADMDHVARELATAYPDADRGVGITVFPLKDDIVGNVRPFLLVLVAAVGLLLLIACANVANLLLARSIGRSREFAIRAALGASRSRVIRQLCTESLVLAGLGGVLGLGIAVWSTTGILHLLPHALPRASDVVLDAHVLIFTFGASLLAAALFGLAPALKASRVDLQGVLRESGRGSTVRQHRLQRVFVAGVIALALVLLVGAGLMVRSLEALWRVDPGFRPDHAITFALSLPSAPATTSADTRARLRRFDDLVRAIPDVEAVSVTLGSRPMIHDTALPFWIDGRPIPATQHDMPQTMCYLVEAGFRPAMGLTVVRGRFVTPRDDERAPVVVDIDDVFARTYFPNENPVGRRIHIAGFDVEAEVVGVVGHVRQWRLDADPASAVEAQIYYPFMQLPEKLMPLAADAVAVVLRTRSDPDAVMASVRRVVHDAEPAEVMYAAQTMDDVVSSSFATRSLSMMLLGIFAGVALTLAFIGTYGVVACLASQRTHEIGVRLALGAPRVEMLLLILGQGARLAVVGTGIGVVAALGLTRLMAVELFAVSAHDPLTFAGVAVLLVMVAMAACYAPARRAMRVDPMIALRHE